MGGGEVQRANSQAIISCGKMANAIHSERKMAARQRQERLLVKMMRENMVCGRHIFTKQLFKLGIIFQIRESNKPVEEWTTRKEKIEVESQWHSLYDLIVELEEKWKLSKLGTLSANFGDSAIFCDRMVRVAYIVETRQKGGVAY